MPSTISEISKRLAQAAISDRLDYSVGKSTDALIRSRQIIYYGPEKTEFKPSEVITINMAAPFVDTRNSFLMFKFQPNSPHLCLSEHGVFSLIDRIRISLSTGQVVEEIEGFSQLMHFLLPWSSDKDFLENYGQVWGHGSYDMGSNYEYDEKMEIKSASGAITQASGTVSKIEFGVPISKMLSRGSYKSPSRGQINMSREQTYCIPLSLLAGIFNIKQYLFLGGLGGIRIDIYLNSATTALKYLGSEVQAKRTVTAAVPANAILAKVDYLPMQPCDKPDAIKTNAANVDATTQDAALHEQGYQVYAFQGTVGYKIKDVEIVAETLTVNDATQVMLNSELANQSLVQTFDTWYSLSNIFTNQNRCNFNISKAAYCIKSLFFVLKDSSRAQSLAWDSHDSLPLGKFFDTFVISAGGSMFPTREIRSLQEAFTHARRAFNLLHTSDLSSVSFEEYEHGNKGLLGLSMEKDDMAPLTGTSTVNGVSINCRITLKQFPDGVYWSPGDVLNRLPDIDVRTFMLYSRLIVFGADPSQHQIYE